MFRNFAVYLVLILLLPVVPLTAQQERASITGQVTDPSGGAVPRARVTIRNGATGATFAVSTDAAGFYSDPQVAPGMYTISVTAAGFATLVRQPDVEVRVNDRLRIDLALQVGEVSQTVAVHGSAPLLQTEDATEGQVIDHKRVTDLPLNGRNWLQLATLAPGTVSYPGVVDGANPQAVISSYGGNRTAQTNYLIDGADNNIFINSGTAAAYPPVDSLQEFKVQTNDYSADTGRLAGAVINATIRSGSNTFHGSAYDFLRNRSLSARNYFANPAAATPEFTRNQFGASLGGPFVRNKLFFFLNYEGNRQRQDVTSTLNVYTDAQKAGDFSSTLGASAGADALGNPVRNGAIYDPNALQTLPNGSLVRAPFPNNIVPQNQILPGMQALIKQIPSANSAVNGVPTYIVDLAAPLDLDTFVGRVDFVKSEKDNISGHIIYTDEHNSVAPPLGLGIDIGSLATSFSTNQRAIQLAWTHMFRASDLNDFRVGFLRNTYAPASITPTQNLNAQYGIPMPFYGPPEGGLASISIAGYTGMGGSASSSQPINKYEISDAYTAIRGPHTLKFGFRMGLKFYYTQYLCTNCLGNFSFNNVYTEQPGFGASGNSIADFLLGIASSANFRTLANEYSDGRDIQAYAQDKWRVSSKLTVTAGVLYAYDPPGYEVRGRGSSVLFNDAVPGSAEIVVPKNMSDANYNLLKNVLFPFMPVARGTNLSNSLVHNAYLNFAPRVGFAYQLNSRTVIRAGYGVFYGFPDVQNYLNSLNAPSRVILSYAGNNINPSIFINQPVVGSNPLGSQLVTPAMFIFNPDGRPDFNQMYNVSVQHELPGNWLVSAGYMGNRGANVQMVDDINNPTPALPNDTSSLQSRRPVTTQLGMLSFVTPQGWSNYNAMTLSAEKRFSQGFSILTSYTWARALGVAPPIVEGINNVSIQNINNLAMQYGPLEFDVHSRFVASYQYELPFGRGRHFLVNASRALDLVIGGWSFNGITTLQDGFPLTPTLSFSLAKTDINSLPDLVGNPMNTSHQPSNWLNPAAFAIPTNAQIAAGDLFGNEGTGTSRSPGLVNFDFSIFKNFAITEGKRLQFRSEFFNLMNTPFFGQPGSVGLTVGTSTFGKVTSAGPPRIVQLALKFLF
jgi:hypothetical protein